ncbi:DUF7003 family protein [Bacillus altitudinis]
MIHKSFLNKEFPILDNENFDFAKVKLSLFTREKNWLFTIQLFGLWDREP